MEKYSIVLHIRGFDLQWLVIYDYSEAFDFSQWFSLALKSGVQKLWKCILKLFLLSRLCPSQFAKPACCSSTKKRKSWGDFRQQRAFSWLLVFLPVNWLYRLRKHCRKILMYTLVSPRSRRRLTTSHIMTENITDRVMIKLGPYLMRRGFFPTYLPDFIDQVIEYNPLLITYTGELHLTNGQLNQLVSVARTGNAEMSNDRGMLRVSMAASIKQVAVSQWLHEFINIRRLYSEKSLENSLLLQYSLFFDDEKSWTG